ncbi:AroM family protein [Alloyangia pacifica]|uniref:AroM protein n=1 Tax=Alloyangia pacifica TaxID=311180 RepID=A0A1I6UZD4_9RHOB|nr:AroM family protein [Alloyangia pacifica]SDI31491.1 AroM protein [Alloyangia pacifica]SFT06697.1 AroM protein [Alloyangia pacifica]
MSQAKRHIGIITTGHGPRDEYLHYHGLFLKALGADVTITLRHIYDGLTLADLDPHEVDKSTPNLGAHVHVPGAKGNHMGDGWEHRFYDLEFATGLVQQAIERLETEDGVDMVLLACAAEFPEGALTARTMLIHPREIMFALAQTIAEGSSRKPKVGVIVDAEHADHDRADWLSRPFAEQIELVVSPITSTWLEAAQALGAAEVEYAFFFGYGVGLAPYDARDEIPALERAIGAPLILPHRATVLHLRNLLMPALNDLDFLPADWNRT